MSKQQEVQGQQPAESEGTKKRSVYELPSLPVEFPPKDDGDAIAEEQPMKSVTFQVQIKVNTNYSL